MVTKRRDVISRISEAAKALGLSWVEIREGANHTVYGLDGLRIPIARHRDIDDQMCRVIYKECEPKLGEKWWTK